jgi:DNA-binding CsgD family transcriptional regulator
MCGRDGEWRIVRELLRRAQRGIGGVLLVEGEWGMGKSALLRESGRLAAAQGFSLASGCADPLGQMVPFFSLLSALNQPFDEAGGEDRPDAPGWWIGQLRARLEERAAVAPVLVCLDDLQWANPGTLLALRTLPPKLARYPLAWILARSVTRQDGHGELVFGSLERGGAACITLGPLGDEAVASLLTGAFGAPPDHGLLELASGAAGNPSLLAELIQGLRDEDAVRVSGGCARLASARRPQRIDRVVRQRLEGFSRPARHLLETAAVLGRSFRLEDAAAMLGETPAGLLPAVEEAADAGLVATADDAFRFRHELIWQAAAQMIPWPARKALHRQFGELLLNRGGSAASAGAHLLEGARPGDPAALTGLDKAAAQTLRTSPQTAARLAVRALELTPAADPASVSRSVAAAEALTAAGRLDEAARIAQDALAQPLQTADEARLRCALSSIRCMSGQARDAGGDAQAVLAQPQLPRGLQDHVIVAHLQAAAGAGDNHVAARVAAGILAAPDEYGRQVVAAAHVARAMISWDEGRISEALGFFRDAARGARGVSPDARHVQPLLALAACLVDLRLLDEADSVIRAADTETLHGIPPQAVPRILRARMHLARGDLGAAAAEGQAALESAATAAAHSYISVAHCILGVVALRQGDLTAAAHHMASRAAQMPHLAGAYARTAATLAEAQVAEARRGPAAVIGQIRNICAGLQAHRGMLLGEPAAAAWLVRTALAADDLDLAAKIAAAADALARDNPGVESVDAAAAHSTGLLHQDPACLAQAAAQHDDPWAQASAAEDLAVLLAAQADRDQAIRHFDAALDGYQRAGATIDTARIRRRLRRLGVRRRHWASGAGRPVSGWQSLTETERATSELVAQGLTNQQIADRMYISVHTIAVHLRRIFSKLGIRSRVDLTRIVFEQAQQPEAG